MKSSTKYLLKMILWMLVIPVDAYMVARSVVDSDTTWFLISLCFIGFAIHFISYNHKEYLTAKTFETVVMEG
jgi:multisubunit Na+/H+ antiporter MnhG subunit